MSDKRRREEGNRGSRDWDFEDSRQRNKGLRRQRQFESREEDEDLENLGLTDAQMRSIR